jgi:hypothetical protein
MPCERVDSARGSNAVSLFPLGKERLRVLRRFHLIGEALGVSFTSVGWTAARGLLHLQHSNDLSRTIAAHQTLLTPSHLTEIDQVELERLARCNVPRRRLPRGSACREGRSSDAGRTIAGRQAPYLFSGNRWHRSRGCSRVAGLVRRIATSSLGGRAPAANRPASPVSWWGHHFHLSTSVSRRRMPL